MSFKDLNVVKKSTIKDGIKLDDMDFVKLDEYIGKSIEVDGFFFTEKGKFGKQVVVIADGKKINIPKRYVSDFEKIRDDDNLLQDMLDGHLGITNIEKIDSKNGKTVAFEFDDV